METVALVGESGSGKSYRAIMVAKEMDIDYIIDDGLLISGTKIVAGKSAKRESSTVSAVKTALFMDPSHMMQVKNAVEKNNPERILVLGTSDRMVIKIASNLGLPEISKIVCIHEISTYEEINHAKNYRKKEGKHVIPVPTFEVKKDFSGYFIDTLKIFRKRERKKEEIFEKTVVRPTFSYFGKYTISPRVVKYLTKIAVKKSPSIFRANNIFINNFERGIIISLDVEILFGDEIIPIIEKLQKQIVSEVEHMTALNIISVDVFVKKIIKV